MRPIAILGLLLASLGLVRGDELNVGDEAPALEATDQDGESVDLAALYKQGTTLVYFFPKALTPG